MFRKKSNSSNSKSFRQERKQYYVHEAVEKDDMELIKELTLINGLDVNEANANGDTPLLYALKLKKEETALFLLECGADPTIANTESIKHRVENAKTKNIKLDENAMKIVTPDIMAKQLGLSVAHAAILEAQARRRLNGELAIMRAATAKPASPRQEASAEDSSQDRSSAEPTGLVKKKTIRQLVSDVSVHAPKSPSHVRKHATGPELSVTTDIKEDEKLPPLGRGPIKEVHSMTARRSSYSPRRASYTPSTVQSETNSEHFLKCAGTECAIM